MLTVVVLAAGESKRFGSQKLLHPLPDGDTLLARAVRARGAYDALVVTSSALRGRAQTLGARVVINDEPERGMAHSLRLADAAIEAEAPILVLPADLLLIEPEHVARIAAAAHGNDIVHPLRADGTPGHPVYFSARARRLVGRLGDNEPIARVRDDPALARGTLSIEDAWPYQDVDRPEDLA